jgi:hypothetical protein
VTPETALLISFFESDEGVSLFHEDFMPEIGGDGDEYGIHDVTTVTRAQMVTALQIYMQGGVYGLSPEITAASLSQSVDWPAVYARVRLPWE